MCLSWYETQHGSIAKMAFPGAVEVSSTSRALHKPRVLLKMLFNVGVGIHSLEESGTMVKKTKEVEQHRPCDCPHVPHVSAHFYRESACGGKDQRHVQGSAGQV